MSHKYTKKTHCTRYQVDERGANISKTIWNCVSDYIPFAGVGIKVGDDFSDSYHPYDQNTHGASPKVFYETVPAETNHNSC